MAEQGALEVRAAPAVKGGLGGFGLGLALTLIAEASGLAIISPGIPIAALLPFYAFAGALLGYFSFEGDK